MAPNMPWSMGGQEEGVASTNAAVLDSTTFQSFLFTTYFKVLKATHQLMAPGETHFHQIKFQPNKVLLGERYNYATVNIKGLTVYTMPVIYGCPVNNNAPTGYTVSTSDAKVNFVTRKSYRYKEILSLQ